MPPMPAIGAYINLSLCDKDRFFSLSGRGQGSGRTERSLIGKSPQPTEHDKINITN